jgi:uncharacterized membrane protein (UPF0127 family)
MGGRYQSPLISHYCFERKSVMSNGQGLPRKPSGPFVIKDGTNGSVVCTEGVLANTFRTRLFGLLGRKGLKQGSGLLIKPSSGVHTFGMSFPIDIVSLDQNHRVLGVFENTGPWTIRGLSLKTRSVLELPAGRIQECGIAPGDELILEAC